MSGQPCKPMPRSTAARSAPAPPTAEEHELAALARALGHPARVRILKILSEHNACICGEIVDALPLAQSTVSQHLKQLKDAGLIQGEIDGPRICYGVHAANLKRLKVLIAGI
jgi:ArsR family transcriptional regulator, arsenate/arsenite/antimonite-responsive transcriptional repressor